MFLLIGFMAVKVVVGILAKSLALISDAGHMLTDVGSIALALVAMRLAKRQASGSYTYGLKRVEILIAQANGVTLLLLSVWVIVEAIRRLIDPPVVEGLLVTVIAVVGIGVNSLAVWAMSKANRQSLNITGSYQHILTDLYAFIATAIAGGIIWWTGWNRVDSIAALMVAGLMLKAGIGLVRDSGRIFLEAASRGLDPEARSPTRSVRSRTSRGWTTCTYGRSPRECKRSRGISSHARKSTATRCAAGSKQCCTIASRSRTRHCKPIIRLPTNRPARQQFAALPHLAGRTRASLLVMNGTSRL